MSTVELRRLRYGHDEGAPPGLANPRKANRSEGIEMLKASILAHGIIQPIAVTFNDATSEHLYVVEGNRRLTALLELRDEAKIDDRYLVPIQEIDLKVAQEAALAANIVRVPLHEADQYEAFSKLTAEGMSEHEIASRFSIEPKRVRRILALGNLSPVILQAWRDGELGHNPVDAVRAFTLAPSIKDQERVFKNLTKNGSLTPWKIREEFGAARGDAGRYLTFVGKEAYEAAGGTVIEDLFGTDHVISAPALVKQLADQKLQEECERLVAEGWSWASPVSELPEGARWNWRSVNAKPTLTLEEESRLAELQAIIEGEDVDDDAYEAADAESEQIQERAKLRGFTAEDMATSGCVLSVSHDGRLEVRAGVIKPGKEKADNTSSKKDDAPKEKKEPTISNALAQRLSVQMTKAAQDAAAESPHLGLAALVAGALSGGGPVKIRLDGLSSNAPRKVERFGAVFERLLEMPTDDLVAAAARLVVRAVSMQTFNAAAPVMKDKENAALVNAIDAALMNAALRREFEAEDYFNSISKPLILKAIEEALNADEARKVGTKGKADLVKFAVGNVPQTGWLPPELRTKHYGGPGSKVTAPPKTSRKKLKAADPVAEAAE